MWRLGYIKNDVGRVVVKLLEYSTLCLFGVCVARKNMP